MEEDCTYTKATLGATINTNQQVLGVCCDPSMDTLIFDLTTIHQKLTELLPTKRNIVSIATPFYYPLGYVTQYWKTSLIAALLILRYGRVKSPQVYLAKNDFLL